MSFAEWLLQQQLASRHRVQREQRGCFPGKWMSPFEGEYMRRSSTRPLHRRLPHIFTVLPTARQTDNAVWLDGQRQCRCARQPEVQSKVDILSTPPAMAAVQVEHRLNIARSHESDRENGYENRSPVFSYERFPSFCIIHYRFITLHQYRTSMQFCGQYTNYYLL